MNDVWKVLGYFCRAIWGDMTHMQVHARTHMHMHAHPHPYRYTHTRTYNIHLHATLTHTYTDSDTYTHTHVRPSIYPFTCLYVCLSVLAVVSLSVCRFVCLSTYESFYLYLFFLSVFWTVSLFVCMSMPLQPQEAMFVFQAPCICWISHRFIPLDIKLSGFLPLRNSRERQPESRAVCRVSEVQYRGIPTREF